MSALAWIIIGILVMIIVILLFIVRWFFLGAGELLDGVSNAFGGPSITKRRRR